MRKCIKNNDGIPLYLDIHFSHSRAAQLGPPSGHVTSWPGKLPNIPPTVDTGCGPYFLSPLLTQNLFPVVVVDAKLTGVDAVSVDVVARIAIVVCSWCRRCRRYRR